LSVYTFFYLSIYLSFYLSICKLENETILRGLIEILKLNAEKRSFSAKRPSNLEVDNIKHAEILREFLKFRNCNIKNEAIPQDFLQKWKVQS